MHNSIEDISMRRHLVVSTSPTIDAGRVVRRAQTLLLGAVIAAMFSGAAVAQSAEKPNEAVRQACAGDVRTLCAGVFPGGGRIKKCVIEKHDQLSDACKSAMLSARSMSGN
jgi:hypothetical protein